MNVRGLVRALDQISMVKVIPKENLDFPRVGVRLSRDVETEIPRWLAELLSDEDKVEIVSTSSRDLQRLMFQEKVRLTPMELPEDTYHVIRNLMEDENVNETIRKDMESLVVIRVGKILNSLRASLLYPKKRLPKNLLAEEVILYSALQSILKEWLESACGIRDE